MTSIMDEGITAIQLDNLYKKAEVNEAIFHKFQHLELHLLNTKTLRALIHIIDNELQHILQLSYVSLLLFDPEDVIKTILSHENVSPNELRHVQLTQDYTLLTSTFSSTLIQKYSDNTLMKLSSTPIPHSFHNGSIIQLPLIRQNCLIGSLNLASNDSTRFDKKHGTLFLDRLAHVVAICIENSINMSQMKLLSLRDVLTGVYNRRYFEERLAEEVAQTERRNSILSCVFLDIDYFKQINDNYGHLVGDKVLKETAQMIKKSLRKTDVLARYGGEEFVILLPDTKPHHVLVITERIRNNIAQNLFQSDNQPFHITLSAGISTYCPRMISARKQTVDICKDLIHNADQALYSAKENGRNQVVCRI